MGKITAAMQQDLVGQLHLLGSLLPRGLALPCHQWIGDGFGLDRHGIERHRLLHRNPVHQGRQFLQQARPIRREGIEFIQGLQQTCALPGPCVIQQLAQTTSRQQADHVADIRFRQPRAAVGDRLVGQTERIAHTAFRGLSQTQ